MIQLGQGIAKRHQTVQEGLRLNGVQDVQILVFGAAGLIRDDVVGRDVEDRRDAVQEGLHDKVSDAVDAKAPEVRSELDEALGELHEDADGARLHRLFERLAAALLRDHADHDVGAAGQSEQQVVEDLDRVEVGRDLDETLDDVVAELVHGEPVADGKDALDEDVEKLVGGRGVEALLHDAATVAHGRDALGVVGDRLHQVVALGRRHALQDFVDDVGAVVVVGDSGDVGRDAGAHDLALGLVPQPFDELLDGERAVLGHGNEGEVRAESPHVLDALVLRGDFEQLLR